MFVSFDDLWSTFVGVVVKNILAYFFETQYSVSVSQNNAAVVWIFQVVVWDAASKLAIVAVL